MWFLKRLAFFALCGSGVLALKPFDVQDDKVYQDEVNFHHYKTGRLQQSNVNETVELIKERLPRVAEIQSYNLTIHPYFPFKGLSENERQDFTFDGNVTIHFTITNDSTTKFPFYSDGLKISKTSLWEDGKELEVKNVNVNPITTLGFVEINKNFELNKKYCIVFEFSGPIRKDDVGLFYNEYINDEGNKGYLIATQFESIYARRMFPCADDPHFKSKITLTLIHSAAAKVYSNSEVDKEELTFSPTYKSTTFKQTPFMSDYLLVFAIGDFSEVSTKSKSGIPIRAISYNKTTLNREVELAAKCLDTMEKLLDIPYKHTQLDHIWVKKITEGDAMENWGLITYADNWVKPLSKYPSGLYGVYSVICHETAHQWFGNLVTGDNWGQTFLHEGFADYFENHALLEDPKTIDPKDVERQIQYSRSLGLKSIKSGKHAIVPKIEHFDAIIYNAGGAVLRMLEKSIGHEKFYEALRIYLTKNAFKTATHEDLISAFEEALQNQPICGDLKIGEVIRDFLLQADCPVVSIKIESQEFVYAQSASREGSDLKWNVPLFVKEERSTEKVQLIWVLKNNTICSTGSQDKLDTKKKYDFNVNLYSFAEVNQS